MQKRQSIQSGSIAAPVLAFWRSMILSQNRSPLFRIMLKPRRDFSNQLPRPDLIPEQTFAGHAPRESACVRSAQTALRDCGGQSREAVRCETVALRRFAAVIFAAAGTDHSLAPVDLQERPFSPRVLAAGSVG